MMIQFSSQATGSIVMFEKDAMLLIRLMGMSGKVPSAIYAEDIPEAITKMNRALSETPDEQNEDDEEEENISINTRAYPLIQILNKAHQEGASVMWDYA